MTAALENRLKATTLAEKREATEWLDAIWAAHRRGEDVSQFIPQPETEPFDAKLAAANDAKD
jgi:hypothetical protein